MERSIEARLDDTELKLRLALRAAHIGIWDWAIDTGQMEYSPRARRIFGFTGNEIVTLDKVRDATHPDDLPRTSATSRMALDPSIRHKEPYEFRIRRSDNGEERWVLAHGEAIFSQVNGVPKAVRYIGTIEDITARKSTELALANSELRQRLALEAAGMAVWEYEASTDRVTMSPELNRMFGLPPDATPSIDDLRAMYAPGERERLQEIAAEAISQGRNQMEAEFRCRRPDGATCWLLLRAELILGSDGNLERAIGVLLDIDRMKRSDDQKILLMRELNHRVKNSISVIQSIASQTFSREKVDPTIVQDFRNRLVALAKANDALVDREWKSFSLRKLIQEITAPYDYNCETFSVAGEEIDLPARLNVPLALVFGELCTNAAKFGSLSVSTGTVRIEWEVLGSEIHLRWAESGGPKLTDRLTKKFGLKLLSEVLPVEIGKVCLIPRSEGLECQMNIVI
ncbi:sensor histidine kinase [Mesorhizobium sp. 10J20-29]